MLVFDIDVSDAFFVGEDKSLVIAVYQSDKRTRQNIAGWTLQWMLKTSLTDEDADALLTKTTTSGIVLTSPTVGVCTISILDTDTDDLTPGTYYHELKRMDANAETVLFHGKCVLRRGVIRT